MIASLPMYATTRTAAADARFWASIRDALRAQGQPAPDTLTPAPGDLLTHWRDPALVLSQTCGLPYRKVLRDHVMLVGTPDYAVEGCPPGHYCSLVITRSDDPRTDLAALTQTRFAYNDAMSQSGWAALALEAPDVLQGPLIQTGSHRASAMAVRTGQADFASIDAVTWRHLSASGDTAGLSVIHRTRPTPGLPFIAARCRDGTVIRQAVSMAIAGLSADDRAILGLRDIIELSPDVYDLPLPPSPQAIGT
ncbi:phosphate/phosphite/phosphonate ABC transporter substrate-binding protein [Yoonia sp. R2-816]|uniref:phosphate/phosphite/phosphonate ABC transporter substrate-binding protein n=1 Tax=Yoonia sp. R2-816 TaxID=3342638 RepID=UPI003728A288